MLEVHLARVEGDVAALDEGHDESTGAVDALGASAAIGPGDRARITPTQASPILRAAMKADCGISTLPNWRIRFLPSFCFSRSLRLRVTSPP